MKVNRKKGYSMTKVKCNVSDCIYCKDGNCSNSNIQVTLYVDEINIGHVECATYNYEK